MSLEKFDLGVIGSGIVGMGVAWAAVKRGLRVAIFEKDRWPLGASIRNFGMIWPIGQPAGPLRETALDSRRLWIELAAAAGFDLQPCGSLHLAHAADELAVLAEFVAQEKSIAADCRLALLDRDATLALTSSANPTHLQGSLWSESECRVDARDAVLRTQQWIEASSQVSYFRDTQISAVEAHSVRAADGRVWALDQVVVCGGAEFRNLRPEIYDRFGFRRCKLHMLRTRAPQQGFRLGPHLASGLTLRHYQSFAGLPSLPALKQRFADQAPELDRYGIHVMMSQASNGDLVLGDSHQYDDDIPPMNDEVIDDLIIRECQKVFAFPPSQITMRWSGVYAKQSQAWMATRFQDNGYALNGFGGAGMTLSLGVADRLVESITNRQPFHTSNLGQEIALC